MGQGLKEVEEEFRKWGKRGQSFKILPWAEKISLSLQHIKIACSAQSSLGQLNQNL